MNDYIIMTDSCCDLPAELAKELDVSVLPLSVLIDDKTYKNYLDGRDISFPDYYALLRAGSLGKTSAVNVFDFTAEMEKHLEEGKDILYMGFSSALSGTYSASTIAAEELREKYPERKILTIDTLSASMGQGLFVYLAVQKKKAGASLEEVYEFVENNKMNIVQWFTVDDLNHLKRGGRVSAVAAVFGTMLSIKPVMHVDSEGRLSVVEKVRGRKASISGLVNVLKERITDKSIAFISHGDCLPEAELLASRLKEEAGVQNVVISYVGPVIGTHSGPGTLAMFFIGTER